jgi:hypothetical protein
MKNKKLLLSALMIFGLTVIFGQNCARMPFGAKGGTEGNIDQALSLEEQEAKGVSVPFALMTGEQVLKSMNALAGNPETNAITGGGVTGTEFRRRVGAFAVGYDLKLTTAPMMLGITSLAGTVCNTAIDRERANGAAKVLFSDVDFTRASSQMSLDSYKAMVRKLAIKFWGREETNEELNILLDGRSEYTSAMTAQEATAVDSTRELALFTCSAMLSSFDAITF